ncbi:hypothetical protein ACWV95_14320 [Streptomyces albus]
MDRHSGAYAAGSASTAVSRAPGSCPGAKCAPSGSPAAISSRRVSRCSWRRVAATCLRSGSSPAVGWFEKSFGHTSRAFSRTVRMSSSASA